MSGYLVHSQILSKIVCPKIRNLPKFSPRSFENVGPEVHVYRLVSKHKSWKLCQRNPRIIEQNPLESNGSKKQSGCRSSPLSHPLCIINFINFKYFHYGGGKIIGFITAASDPASRLDLAGTVYTVYTAPVDGTSLPDIGLLIIHRFDLWCKSALSTGRHFICARLSPYNQWLSIRIRAVTLRCEPVCRR